MQQYRRLSYENRCQIFAFLGTKTSIKEMSRRLCLHKSTIYRELYRNRTSQGLYDPATANVKAIERREQFCRRRAKLSDPVVLKIVERGLRADLSPQQIAGRYKVSSHQTIYNSLRGANKHLAQFLRRYGKKRGRGRFGRRKTIEKPSWFLSISKRPREVDLRKTIGHWERDTMYLKDRSMLLVCLERKSRFVRIQKLKQHVIDCTNKQSMKMMSVLGKKPLTITNDNGTEFYGESHLNVPIYYCDPYSPQQRGSVENVIGLIRQYLTRKTDINLVTSKQLRLIERKLNNRPRKCLNFRTPYEILVGNDVAMAV